MFGKGERLGPYEIVGLLGSGGMGDVYRAHDNRLRRDVAIKVLHSPAITNANVAAVTREARAVGNLNHPNILAVYDVDTSGGVPYVVTELLEGETLRARLDAGKVPLRKAVDYAIQIAQALAAAHSRGIWHRDVKPANVFLTKDGHVKLLDFGLARMIEPDGARQSHDETTASGSAGSDAVCGTAGYMSPEQVLGQPVDHRTDIFALGAVLYEMVTGVRAFKGSSTAETIAAVLRDDPIDPLSVNPALPPAAAAVVRRCLEKDRDDRFQSARDLIFALQQLRDQSSTSATFVVRRIPRRVALTAAGLLIVAAVAALAAWLLRPQPDPIFEQLTFHRGRIGGARFSTDGRAVVYSGTREGTRLEISRLDLGASSQPLALGFPLDADVLAARAGELALSLRRRFVLGERFVGTLAIAPIGGGAPREVAEHVEDADWDSTGEKLAMVRSSGDVGGHSWIEYDGRTLHKTAGSIRFLRISRDGRRIAFLEDASGRGASGKVVVVDVSSGNVTNLTDDWETVRGLAWSPRGDEIWFTAGAIGANRSLRAVNLQRELRTVLEAPGSLTLWDVASDGRVLLTRDEERRAIVGQPPGEVLERDLSWFDNSALADLSEDGLWLLFRDRFGLYLRQSNGAPAIHLGLRDAFADHISPDGKTVLATVQSRQLVLVPTGAGEPRPLPTHNIDRYSGALWFPDSRRILFTGRERGRDLRSYIQDISGGPPSPLTPEGIWALSISPDGQLAAAIGPEHAISLWPIDGGPSQPVHGSQPGDRPVAWSADGQSLWLFRRGEVPTDIFRLNVATGRRELWKTLLPPDPAGVYSIIEFRVTPTGHSYFYSYTRLLSQLYVVSGVR